MSIERDKSPPTTRVTVVLPAATADWVVAIATKNRRQHKDPATASGVVRLIVEERQALETGHGPTAKPTRSTPEPSAPAARPVAESLYKKPPPFPQRFCNSSQAEKDEEASKALLLDFWSRDPRDSPYAIEPGVYPEGWPWSEIEGYPFRTE